MNKKFVRWAELDIRYLFSEAIECYTLVLIWASQQSHLLASSMILWNHPLLFLIDAILIILGVYLCLNHTWFDLFSAIDFSFCTFSPPFHLWFDLLTELFYVDQELYQLAKLRQLPARHLSDSWSFSWNFTGFKRCFPGFLVLKSFCWTLGSSCQYYPLR